MPGKACRWAEFEPTEPCQSKARAQGLCALHYKRAVRQGSIEVGKTNVGRPALPVPQPPEGDWWEGPEPSDAYLRGLAKKWIEATLKNPNAGQQERNLAVKLAHSTEAKETDPALSEKFQELMGRTRGLKAVPDE